MKISTVILNKIWDILVSQAGAIERERNDFINYFLEEGSVKEYRFRGKLGFGGKIKRNSWDIFICFYSEDHTEERSAIKEKVNFLIKEILSKESLDGRAEQV